MLVLSRKPGEKILIGDNVSVTVVRIGPNTVRIGIEAPQSMNIRREGLPNNHVGEIENEQEESKESIEASIEDHSESPAPSSR